MNRKPSSLIAQNDAGVLCRINSAGKLQVKVTSAVLAGRGTVYTLHQAGKLSEIQRRQAVMKVAALMSVRQNELYGDNHDPEEVMRKADDALARLMKDARPVAAVGLFTTFQPLGTDAPGKKTSEIVSRMSEDDPLTRDLLKGKDWD